MTKRYRLLNDPIFYITVILFALLTTALPAIIGQPLFLPLVQTIALFAFMTIALHQKLIRQTVVIFTLWLVIQFVVILLLTTWAEQRVQQSFADGFLYRMAYVEWFFDGSLATDDSTMVANALRPDSFSARPWARLLELAGVTLGSLFTLGLVGIWFLVRAVNLTAFSMGAVILAGGEAKALIGGIPIWALIRISGYAGLVILLAEPLLTSNWNPLFYLRERRRLLILSVALTGIGLLLELFLPNSWRMLFW